MDASPEFPIHFLNIYSKASIDRVESLKNAVALVKQEHEKPEENCDDRLTYRTLFDYASALDAYSKTFPTGSESQKNWSLEAASPNFSQKATNLV
jgi:hypothetical protein